MQAGYHWHMPERTFFLKPRPPLRAFAIAAVMSLVGALLLVAALQSNWHIVVVVISAAILVLGVALFLASLVAMWRLGVRVTVDDDGYEVSGTNQTHSGKWADVTKITQAVEGAHITIYHGSVVRTHLIFPGGPAQDQMQDVVDAIMERLKKAKA